MTKTLLHPIMRNRKIEERRGGLIIIIDELVKQRRCKGITQKELAKEACLTQSVIARFENKKIVPKLDTLMKIAAALECDIVVMPKKY